MEPLQYLTDEWLAAADAAMAGLVPLENDVIVCLCVSDGPTGDTVYRLMLGSERVGVLAGDGEHHVKMSMSWNVAVSIAQGKAGAQRAFLDGHIQLAGDTTVLLGYQQQLADIDDRLVDLRAQTLYS